MHVGHWMQFSTFAEKEFFIYPTDKTYDGIFLNANMVVHASAAMAAFLIEKRGQGVKYIIDPMTHAFQHDPVYIMGGKGEPKSSIKNLAEHYGHPVTSILGSRGISASDFTENAVKREFAARVLDFQKNYLKSYMEAADSYKYLVEDEKDELNPSAVLAPYFYITEANFEKIVPLNKALLEISLEIESDIDVFGMCVLSQGAMTNTDIRSFICESYRAVNCSGFTVWVDDLAENKASINELESFCLLGQGLSGDKNRSVINMHGGFFSIVASACTEIQAFSDVCHGPEFGESRSVVPVGGGIPISRFYVPDLHTREKYRDALSLFSAAEWLNSPQTFFGNVCDCPQCRSVIGDSIENFRLYGESDARNMRRKHGVVRIDFPTSDAKKLCLRHYLESKYKEYAKFEDASSKDIISDLDASIQKFGAAAGESFVGHLIIWKAALNKFLNAS